MKPGATHLDAAEPARRYGPPVRGCLACKVEREDWSVSEAFVLGLMVADVQARRLRRIEGTLCNAHGRFPHA